MNSTRSSGRTATSIENDFREPILLWPRAAEVDLPGSHRVAQSTEKVLQEERLGEGRLGVTHVRIERASAVEIVVPAHGMVVAVRPALIAFLVDVHQYVDAGIDRLEVVELVLAIPAVGQSLGGRVVFVEHAERAFANVGVVRMAGEPRAG
jgi:hypothetical protein